MERRMGCCLRCGNPCFDIQETWSSGLLVGQPRVLGAHLETATQLRCLMSDGTVIDVDCCVECAPLLGPDEYDAMWRAIIDYTDLVYRHWCRPENERIRTVATLREVFIVDRLVCRRPVPELGRCVVDRRVSVG